MHATADETIYEVSLDVDAAVAADFLAWLRGHIDEICALPGFLGADLHELADPAPAPGRLALCVRYRLRDAAALETYLRDHAPRMRGEGLARFGGRFDASRRVMRVLPR
ncbi:MULTISPECIES: DUF4286 family protein [Lysobacter]|uniref:DUF4286 family protein n=1 Tax=Lysobacter yananisis TaxID=1003114 RepID=A0ABY9PFH1_9GAMM|nr:MULTISPECIES: DUF4286 family protein [Lysobacter]QQQ01808.1 DUF4286 family protein [Lysobacter enzymogenes]WMT04961.1 DUF4286 family protein [Lysobacter yananisis]